MTQEILEEWSKNVPLPKVCPNCEKTIDYVRFYIECQRATIHLTGVTHETDFLVAECSQCEHRIKVEPLDKKTKHWK